MCYHESLRTTAVKGVAVRYFVHTEDQDDFTVHVIEVFKGHSSPLFNSTELYKAPVTLRNVTSEDGEISFSRIDTMVSARLESFGGERVSIATPIGIIDLI